MTRTNPAYAFVFMAWFISTGTVEAQIPTPDFCRAGQVKIDRGRIEYPGNGQAYEIRIHASCRPGQRPRFEGTGGVFQLTGFDFDSEHRRWQEGITVTATTIDQVTFIGTMAFVAGQCRKVRSSGGERPETCQYWAMAAATQQSSSDRGHVLAFVIASPNGPLLFGGGPTVSGDVGVKDERYKSPLADNPLQIPTLYTCPGANLNISDAVGAVPNQRGSFKVSGRAKCAPGSGGCQPGTT